MPSNKKKQGGTVGIPIRWGKSDQLETVYANNLFITNAGSEFYLVFGEVAPPTESAGGQPPPKFVEVKPVVRIAISPQAMIQIANVIGQNVSRFMDRLQDTALHEGAKQ